MMFDTQDGLKVTAITAAADLIHALLDCDPDATAHMTATDHAVRNHAARWLATVDGRDDTNLWPYNAPTPCNA